MHKDDIYRLLGRNLAIYQRIELLAKTIGEMVLFSAEKTAPGEGFKTFRSNCAQFTLGQAIPEYLRIFEQDQQEEHDIYLKAKIKITISHPDRGLEKWSSDLKQVVSERNWLVHKSIVDIDVENEDSRESFLARMDNQYAFAVDVAKVLDEQYKAIVELKDDSVQLLLSFLCATRALSDIKKLKPDVDGWVLFQRFECFYNRAQNELIQDDISGKRISASECVKNAGFELLNKEHCGCMVPFVRFNRISQSEISDSSL